MRFLILLLPLSVLAFPRTKNNIDGSTGSLKETLTKEQKLDLEMPDKPGHIFNGDMLLSERQVSLLKTDSGHGRDKRQVSDLFTNKWTNNTLYYYFDASLNARKRASVQEALSFIRDRTCIDFVQSSTAVNRVKVFSGSGCFSEVGTEGGEQLLSLGNGCESVGTAAHEFLHALGFLHTHQRADRDDYVDVDLSHVSPSSQNQFNRNTFVTHYVPYEYGSVMHYAAVAFSNTSGALTITAKDKRFMHTMGGGQISPYDIKAVNDFYQCYDRCPTNSRLKNGAVVNPRTCGANCPDGYAGALCDEKPAGCGQIFAASGNWQRKSFPFGDPNDRTISDIVKRCTFWITSPKDTQIEVKLVAMTNERCTAGCTMHGIEFKVDKDPMLTNPRLCCSLHLNQVSQSELNPMPINLHKRTGGNTYTIEFRYIDLPLSKSCTEAPTTNAPTAPTTTTAVSNPTIINRSLVPLTRMYSTLEYVSYASNYHSDAWEIEALEDEGYGIDVDIGRIVDLDIYDYNSEVSYACPELVKLRAFLHPVHKTQFMTTIESEAQDHLRDGWTEIRSVGYCVSAPKCGATRKLGYVSAHDDSDIYYSTDENELETLNTVQMYAETLVSPVCWLFEDADEE